MSDDAAGGPLQPRDVCAPRSSPNRVWVCGYAELGKCCASGPSSKGRCSLAIAASQLDSAATVDAADAPVPCIPRRSAQWKRQSLCLNLAILTGAILLLCMTLPSREKTFVPGELSSKHAQILHNTLVAQRCGLCHPNSHAGGSFERAAADGYDGEFSGLRASPVGHSLAAPGNEPAAGLNFFSGDDGRQDALCLQCHQGHMPGASARTPHDVSVTMLQTLAQDDHARSGRPMDDKPLDVHHAQPAKTNCAACHVEHHGRGFDLKAMTDDRCQACHRRKFASFTDGHPEFKNFPAQRPRSLAFSHGAHADKHFPQKNRDFDCRQCHLDDARSGHAGQVARSVSFENACAQCHREAIRAATAGGWAVLQLPSIDPQAATAGAPLARWPIEARFGFEGTISPALRALLAADDAAHEALAHLPQSGELANVLARDGLRAQVAQSLALATERLIRESASDGQAAWSGRLTKVARARLKRELHAQETAIIEAMCAGLPPDLFRQMQVTWFDGQASPADAEPAQAGAPAGLDSEAAADPSSVTLDAAAPRSVQPDADVTPEQRLKRPGIVVERRAGSLLVSDGVGAKAAPQVSDVSKSEADSDLLLDAPLGDDVLENDALGDDELLGGSATAGLSDSEPDDLSALVQPENGDGKHAHSGTEPINAPISGAAHLPGGGWFIDRATLSLRYMPTAHADRTLAAWNMWYAFFDDAGTASLASPAKSIGGAAPAQSVALQIPGGCIQCHQLNSNTAALLGQGLELMAQWRTPTPRSGAKEFTKFNHAPHLHLPAVNDCRYCHVRDKSGPDGNPPLVSIMNSPHDAHAGSEFRAMRLMQCVACHRPSSANSGCLQCHNYHVTSPPRVP